MTLTHGKRVAHLAKYYLPRTESFIGCQIEALDRYKPSVFCKKRLDDHRFNATPIASVDEILGPYSRFIEDLASRSIRVMTPFAAQKLQQLLGAVPVDVVHCHYLTGALYFLPALRGLRLPKFVSAYGYDVSSFPKAAFGLALHWIQRVFKEFEIVLAMSNDMKQDLMRLGCPEEKIIVHYHGIDTARFAVPGRSYEQPHMINILISGRLVPKKGHSYVLKALKLVEKELGSDVPVRLNIVGDGPLRRSLETTVRELGLQDCVLFRGHVPYRDPALFEHFRMAHMFILPSITAKGEKEGIPGTLVEAMAAGLPVISTYHAGIPEVVDSDRTGVLVKEGDVEALANAMVHLARLPNKRRQLGEAAALRAASEFNYLVRAQALQDLYDRELDSRR